MGLPPLKLWLTLPTIITGLRPVDFPLKVFRPGDLSGVQLLLAQEPFPHELIHKAIVEVNTNRRLSGPVVRVVVADGGIIGGSYLAGVADKLKRLADDCGICLLLVHHTRKQQADDKFDMISGTNGLLGAADGAFLLQKEKRTDGSAILDVAGRDQQDQRMYLTKDRERLVWELERLETEPWVEPPDPVLEAVAALVTADRPTWGGTATELAAAIQTDMKPNALAMRLNVRAGRLATEYHIRYENSRSHAGRSITLTLEPPQA